MIFGFGKQKVQMTVINADDGQFIAKSALRPEDIPERFDLETTIHLGDQEFHVVEADPIDRERYTKSGKLTLKVRKVEYISPQEILFSLPTICNEIGAIVPADTIGKRILQMHEDDWRQIELISKSLSAKIEGELSSIEEIYREKRVAEGFKALHVRKEIKEPLTSCNLTLTELKLKLEFTTVFDGIGYYTFGGPAESGLVKNGFAFEGAAGLIVYGLVLNDVCTTIGITGSNVTDPEQAAGGMARLLANFELVLVDWCRASTPSSAAQLQRYFETLVD